MNNNTTSCEEENVSWTEYIIISRTTRGKCLVSSGIGIALTVTFMISGIDREKYNREEWQYLDLDMVPYGLREEAQDYSMPADTPSRGNTCLQPSATRRSFYQYPR